MDPIVGRLTVPQIKVLAMEIAAEGQPFRLAKVQRRSAYKAKGGRLLCAVGYCDGGQALDELHREGKLALVETDHLGFKTYSANAQISGGTPSAESDCWTSSSEGKG